MSYVDRVTGDAVEAFYKSHPWFPDWARSGDSDLHLWPHIQRAAQRARLHGWLWGFGTGVVCGTAGAWIALVIGAIYGMM